MTRRIGGVGEIAGEFDAFVVDQFGVLHDGRACYPGAVEALRRLTARGPVALMSNSGKRAAANIERLERLGIGRECYTAFVSSGEVAHGMIAGGELAVPPRARTLVVSRGDGAAALDGLDLVATDDPRTADLVVIAGSQSERIAMADYETLLRPAAERGVRALCTNPDHHMLADGAIHPGAGAIAAVYAAMGGPVAWIGKPHRAIYEHAARALAPHLAGGFDWGRTLGIGDSLAHDVAGVRRMGGAALLVETGVAAKGGQSDDPTPDYTMAALAW